MWVDAHAHLASLDSARLDAVVQRMYSSGVAWAVNTATDLTSSQEILDQHRRHTLLRPAVGISPFDAGRVPPDWVERLSRLAAHPSVVAIGETGLDRSNPRYPESEKQLTLFERHAELALLHGLPLVVHSRGAERELAERCRNLGIRRAVFHCFTGDHNSLERILENGYVVSLSGIVTYRGAAVAKLVRLIPRDMLLLETDSPYLSPEPWRRHPNDPSRLPLIGQRVAEMLEITAEELANIVHTNATRMFCRQPKG